MSEGELSNAITLLTHAIAIDNNLRWILFIGLDKHMQKIARHRLKVFDHFQRVLSILFRSLFARTADVLRRRGRNTGHHRCDGWFTFGDDDVRHVGADEHEHIAVRFRLLRKELLEGDGGIDSAETCVHLLRDVFDVRILKVSMRTDRSMVRSATYEFARIVLLSNRTQITA